MCLNAKTHWLLFIVQMFMVKTSSISPPSKDLKNLNKFNLHEWAPIYTLRVSTIQHEPFMYQSESEVLNGVEYKLIQVIAEKQHLNLSIQFHKRFRPSHFNQLLYK